MDGPGDYSELRSESDDILEFPFFRSGVAFNLTKRINPFFSRSLGFSLDTKQNNFGFSYDSAGDDADADSDADAEGRVKPAAPATGSADATEIAAAAAARVPPRPFRRNFQASGFVFPGNSVDYTRVEGEYSHRLSRRFRTTFSGISTNEKDASHLNSFLLFDSQRFSGCLSYTTDEMTGGANCLWAVNDRVAVGGELFYTHEQQSGGLSVGARYAKVSEEEEEEGGLRTVITAILNPVMGHFSTTYTAEASDALAMSARLEYNLHNQNSDVSVGLSYDPARSPYSIKTRLASADGLGVLLLASFSAFTLGVSCSAPLRADGAAPEIGAEVTYQH